MRKRHVAKANALVEVGQKHDKPEDDGSVLTSESNWIDSKRQWESYIKEKMFVLAFNSVAVGLNLSIWVRMGKMVVL